MLSFFHYKFFFLLLVLFLLKYATGCFPTTYESHCWMQIEAEKVALSYEEMFEVELSNEDFQCVHDFEVTWATDEEITDFCNFLPNQGPLNGCFRVTALRPGHPPLIMLSVDYRDQNQLVWVFRHEATHLLLWCVEGNLDKNHHHPAFDMPDDPDNISIMEYANSIKETTWVCE
jgi:hypothetical protein